MHEDGKGLLADEVRNVLKIAACNLYLKQKGRMRISNMVCDGVIQTEGKSFFVAPGFSGILFKAQVDTGQGEFKVNFLLNEEHLDTGAEIIRRFEEEEFGWEVSKRRTLPPFMTQFEDLSHRSGRTLN